MAVTESENEFACETLERRTVQELTWTAKSATLNHAPEILQNPLATGQPGPNAVFLAESVRRHVPELVLTIQDDADGTPFKISSSASVESPVASGQAGAVGERAQFLATSVLEHAQESVLAESLELEAASETTKIRTDAMLRLVRSGTRGQTGQAVLKRAAVDFPDEADTAVMAAAVLETNTTRKCVKLTDAPFGKTGVSGPPATKSAVEAGKKESEPAKMAIQVNAAALATTKSRQDVIHEIVQLGNPGQHGPSAALRAESAASIDTDTATTKENATAMKLKATSALLEHARAGRTGQAGQNAPSHVVEAAIRRGTENAAARESACLILTLKTRTHNFNNVKQQASAHLGGTGRHGTLAA